MIKFKNIVFILIVVFFSSCKKNDTVRDMGSSQGYAANVYMEAQSDILLAGSSFKLPVTYWLPNTEIDSLTLRETKDSTIEMSFKQIAGSSFAYSSQFVGNIDSNKVYQVYQHSEDNWSDAHYSYRIHAEYNSTTNMSAVYKEKFAEVNEFLMQPGANSDSIMDKLAYDYVIQMTKDQLHRSIVSVCTQEEFDNLWSGFTVDGVNSVYFDYCVIKGAFAYIPNTDLLKRDELLSGLYYDDVWEMLNYSDKKLYNLLATKRPQTKLGIIVMDTISLEPLVIDTAWIAETPYYSEQEYATLFSDELMTPSGEIFVKNNLGYEKIFDSAFDIDYLLSERVEDLSPEGGSQADPVYAKADLYTLFVENNFVLDENTFSTYFSDNEMIIEGKIEEASSQIKKIGIQKMLGYKPKTKRIYSVTLEFQVKGDDGVIGKSKPAKFNIK